MTDNAHPIKPEISEEIKALATQISLKQRDGGTFWADSLEVAKKFDKRHDNVLRAIENLKAQAPQNQLNFEVVDYTDAKGEKRPCYLMNRDGFSLLVMGFTGGEAIKWKLAYIEAFNMMEAELTKKSRMTFLPSDLTRKQILLMALEAEERAEQERAARIEADKHAAKMAHAARVERAKSAEAEAQMERMAPKAFAYDRYMDADGLFTLQAVGKILFQKANRFASWARDMGYLYYRDTNLVPYARYDGRLFIVKPVQIRDDKKAYQTFVTKKGLDFFLRKTEGLFTEDDDESVEND